MASNTIIILAAVMFLIAAYYLRDPLFTFVAGILFSIFGIVAYNLAAVSINNAFMKDIILTAFLGLGFFYIIKSVLVFIEVIPQ